MVGYGIGLDIGADMSATGYIHMGGCQKLDALLMITKENDMDANTISAIAGVTLSLGFSYIPGLSTWFAKQDSTRKRGLMALLLLLATAGSLLYVCRGDAACLAADWERAVGALIAALVANQSVFLLTPSKPAA